MIPKFRAWHKELKMMFEVKSLVYTLRVAALASRDDIVPSRTCSFDDIILMQSTGLKDEHDVEIFDGDVVNFMVPNQMISGTYQIRQANSGEWRLDNRVQGRSLYISGSHNCEVVGNIYELESVEE